MALDVFLDNPKVCHRTWAARSPAHARTAAVGAWSGPLVLLGGRGWRRRLILFPAATPEGSDLFDIQNYAYQGFIRKLLF
jgi:hypothetical protein